MRLLIALLSTVVTVGAGTGTESVRGLLEKAIAGKTIPGALVIVQQHGKIIIEEAAGIADLETGRKWTASDIVMLASSSKPFAATTILTLVDRGKLRLDDPVSKFYPEFQGTSTIRQLLSHTSGIFGNDGTTDQVKWIRDFDRPLADAVAGIVKLPLMYQPGEKYV